MEPNEGLEGAPISHVPVSISRYTTRVFGINHVPARYVTINLKRFEKFDICELSIIGVPATGSINPPTAPQIDDPVFSRAGFNEFSSLTDADWADAGYQQLHMMPHDYSLMTHIRQDATEYYAPHKVSTSLPSWSLSCILSSAPSPWAGTVRKQFSPVVICLFWTAKYVT